MNDEQQAQVSSGYEILQIYALEQFYDATVEPAEAPQSQDDKTTEPPLGVNWDWRVISEREFEVQFGIEMAPSPDIHEYIRVRFVLRAKAGEEVTIPVAEFVGAPAISVLVPYLREAITSMSVRGPIGVRYLNPLNVRALAKRFPFEESMGAGQLKQDPELAALYGWEPAS